MGESPHCVVYNIEFILRVYQMLFITVIETAADVIHWARCGVGRAGSWDTISTEFSTLR
jgi:hypothetical protein